MNIDTVQRPKTKICGHLCLFVVTSLMREHLSFKHVMDQLNYAYSQYYWQSFRNYCYYQMFYDTNCTVIYCTTKLNCMYFVMKIHHNLFLTKIWQLIWKIWKLWKSIRKRQILILGLELCTKEHSYILMSLQIICYSTKQRLYYKHVVCRQRYNEGNLWYEHKWTLLCYDPPQVGKWLKLPLCIVNSNLYLPFG